MSRKPPTGITGEELDAMGLKLDGLSRELNCLIELGVLSTEETGALFAYLEYLWMLLARLRFPDAPLPSGRLQLPEDVNELSGMVGLLAADIDLAYRRLGAAA